MERRVHLQSLYHNLILIQEFASPFGIVIKQYFSLSNVELLAKTWILWRHCGQLPK